MRRVVRLQYRSDLYESKREGRLGRKSQTGVVSVMFQKG